MHVHRGVVGALALVMTTGVFCVALSSATTEDNNHDTYPPTSSQTTHAFFLLDRTGSMSGKEIAVKNGFNSFVEEQNGVRAGRMFLDVAQFDSENPFELLLEKKPIADVVPLERFEPRATTPLYDAISDMIDHAARVADTPDVIVVVFTDGAENASTRASKKSVLQRVEEKKKLGWTFVFLGSNIDAYATGSGLGYARGSTKTHGDRPQDYQEAWSDVSAAMINTRKARMAPSYTAEMRKHDSANYFG